MRSGNSSQRGGRNEGNNNYGENRGLRSGDGNVVDGNRAGRSQGGVSYGDSRGGRPDRNPELRGEQFVKHNGVTYMLPKYDRNRDKRFRYDHERCRLCFGIGFLFSHDGLHRHRCTVCHGHGFSVGYYSRMNEFCPLCFARVWSNAHSRYSTDESIARMETNQLSVVLDLSDRQANRIYRINLRYIRHMRYGDIQYEMQLRDKDILDVLNRWQQERYLDYLSNLDNRDLCDHCFELR